MTKTTEDKRLKEVKKVIEEWDTYPRERRLLLSRHLDGENFDND